MQRLLSKLRSIVRAITLALIILWALFAPSPEKTVRKKAAHEIKKLQKQNKEFQKFRQSLSYKFVSTLDDHQVAFVVVLVILLTLPWVIVNLPWGLDVPEFSEEWYWQIKRFFKASKEGDNYHSVMSTIQATVMSLIIPISIALHEFVLKDKKLKEDMINFILKEARVRLITVSAIAFLIWVGIVECLKVWDKDLLLSGWTMVVECAWFTTNLILIAYFMFITLKLLNRHFFDEAISRFIANELYPQEVKGYLERNIYFNLSRRKEDSDDK